MPQPLVRIKNLSKHFMSHSGLLKDSAKAVLALDNVSFEIYEGETLDLLSIEPSFNFIDLLQKC